MSSYKWKENNAFDNSHGDDTDAAKWVPRNSQRNCFLPRVEIDNYNHFDW